MSDIVNRLRTNRECLAPCLMDDAADEIVRLERVMLDLIAEHDRQIELIATLRQELKESKARNTMYLSRIQEYEAREY